MTVEVTGSNRWPIIPVADWQDTRDTLRLYTQIVGKVRLANEPLTNHWWNVPLYVSARGLTTSLMPHPTGPAFQIDFDFVDHRLDVTSTAGAARSLSLDPLLGPTAPPHPGGAPNCGPHVMWEAYSHEVSSAGYWPGPPGEGGKGRGLTYGPSQGTGGRRTITTWSTRSKPRCT